MLAEHPGNEIERERTTCCCVHKKSTAFSTKNLLSASEQRSIKTFPPLSSRLFSRSRVKGECKSSPSAKNSIYSAGIAGVQDRQKRISHLRQFECICGMIAAKLGSTWWLSLSCSEKANKSSGKERSANTIFLLFSKSEFCLDYRRYEKPMAVTMLLFLTIYKMCALFY